jgi:hypothetical protein
VLKNLHNRTFIQTPQLETYPAFHVIYDTTAVNPFQVVILRSKKKQQMSTQIDPDAGTLHQDKFTSESFNKNTNYMTNAF